MKIIREEYSIRLIPDRATDDPERVLFDEELNSNNLYWDMVDEHLYLVDCSNMKIMKIYDGGDCSWINNAIDALLKGNPVNCPLAGCLEIA